MKIEKGLPEELLLSRIPRDHHDCWYALDTDKRLYGCGDTREQAIANLKRAEAGTTKCGGHYED